MGRFQKVAGDEPPEVEEAGGQESLRRALCCGCLTSNEAVALLAASALFALIALMAAGLAADAVAKQSLAVAASGILGARTAVSSVNFHLLDAFSSISQVRVDNPRGYSDRGTFLRLGEAVFALGSPLELFGDTWELHDVQLSAVEVHVDVQSDYRSNANFLAAHLLSLARGSGDGHGGGGDDAQEEQLEDLANAKDDHDSAFRAHLVKRRFRADRLSFQDVKVSVCIRPACEHRDTPERFEIQEVRVEDVGQKTDGGVELHELIHVAVQCLLTAIIQSAPGKLGGELHRSFGQSLRAKLDAGTMRVDTAGGGLQEAKDWRTWELQNLGLGTGGGMIQALSNATARVAALRQAQPRTTRRPSAPGSAGAAVEPWGRGSADLTQET